MDKQTHDKLDEILSRVIVIEKEVQDLKTFKNRVLGGLAVFVFTINLMFKHLF